MRDPTGAFDLRDKVTPQRQATVLARARREGAPPADQRAAPDASSVFVHHPRWRSQQIHFPQQQKLIVYCRISRHNAAYFWEETASKQCQCKTIAVL